MRLRNLLRTSALLFSVGPWRTQLIPLWVLPFFLLNISCGNTVNDKSSHSAAMSFLLVDLMGFPSIHINSYQTNGTIVSAQEANWYHLWFLHHHMIAHRNIKAIHVLLCKTEVIAQHELSFGFCVVRRRHSHTHTIDFALSRIQCNYKNVIGCNDRSKSCRLLRNHVEMAIRRWTFSPK